MVEILIGLVGVIAALVGAFFAGKSKGKAKAEQKLTEVKAEQKVKAAERKTEVQNARNEVRVDVLGGGSPGDAAERLRDEWSRD